MRPRTLLAYTSGAELAEDYFARKIPVGLGILNAVLNQAGYPSKVGNFSRFAPERLARIARRFVETAERDPAGARMLLRQRDGKFLDAPSRDAAREFREAVQQIVAAGKADGMVRAGPAELWTSVWLVILAFIIERVSAREWTMDQPQVAQAIEAAWSAIAAPAQPGPGRTSSPEGPAAEG